MDEIITRGGERIEVRPIRGADAPQLVAMHARLSGNSIYRRYFGARPRLSPAEVHRFTQVVEKWRFALVGVRTSGDIVAVARYEGRDRGDARTDTAELALVVDDSVQRLGVGAALLSRLLDVAHVRGVAVVVADVLPGNTAMRRLLMGLGLRTTTSFEEGVVTVRLHLDSLNPTPHRLAVARGHLAQSPTMTGIPPSAP